MQTSGERSRFISSLDFFFFRDKNNKSDELFEVITSILHQQLTAVIPLQLTQYCNVDSTNPSEKVPSVLLLH